MREHQNEEGRFSLKAHGLGTITEATVRERARELALINGRGPHQILDSDLEEARRELTGQEGLTPEPTAAEQLLEDSRWESVPESIGHKAPTVPAADEQTFAEKLVDEGVEDAEQDQMLRATRESWKRDRA